MSKKPDEYYWRGPGGDGWSRKESSDPPETGSRHGVGTEGELDKAHNSGEFSDDSIRQKICASLSSQADLAVDEIEVLVKDGEVTLRGTVENSPSKSIAGVLAKAVLGVAKVNNKIKVSERRAS